MPKFTVVHIPQLPMEGFRVEVSGIVEAVKLMETLGLYDLLQFHNNIKPDYCNMSFLELSDPDDKNKVAEWYIEFEEDVNGEYYYFEEPEEFIEYLENVGMTEQEFYNQHPELYKWVATLDNTDDE